MRSLKVLVSAYACRPGLGSEPGVGWNTVRELVKHHKVWVITRSDNRASIEAELNTNPIPGLEFVYCDLAGYQWWKKGLLGVHLHNYLWQIQAYLLARKLNWELQFDVVHHVTYVRYSSPSFLSLLPVPFIWGPVGGGESAPKSFYQDFSLRGKVYERLREVGRWFGEADPFVRMTARRSALAQATTEDTADRLRKIGAENIRIFSQLGLSPEEITQLKKSPSALETPIRFISIGRLLHWKGFHLALKAFAQANLSDAEYWILGNGPEYQRLQALARELNIEQRVTFWQELPRDRVLEKLGECAALVHPSLHDSGGLVCLEAMAAGQPVVCLDLGGPATQVTEETGFKIAAHTPEQAIHDLAVAMTCLANDAELRSRMGQAAQIRASEVYSWEKKGQLLAQLYEEISAS